MIALDDIELGRMLAEARAAWPGVEVPSERFREALARSRDSAEDGLHAADLYLALGCLDGGATALEAFDREVLRAVRPAIVRACKDGADAEDAVQATLEKLLVGDEPKLAQYTGRGSLVAWVRVVGVRAALEARRRTRRETVRDETAIVAADVGKSASIDLAVLRARHAEAFRTAVQEALRRLTVEQRTLLRMNVRDGLSIDRLAPMLGIHRATAARRLERARADALAHTRAILEERDGLSASEAKSLCLALVRDVDVSIGRALADEPPA